MTGAPSSYESDIWGCGIKFTYPILKILDFRDKKDELMQNNNAFAMAILCQLAAIKTQYNPTKRQVIKFNLI